MRETQATKALTHRITVQVLIGATGEYREVVAHLGARSEQEAVDQLFGRARRDDYYYRFLGQSGVIVPSHGTPVVSNNQTYWANE